MWIYVPFDPEGRRVQFRPVALDAYLSTLEAARSRLGGRSGYLSPVDLSALEIMGARAFVAECMEVDGSEHGPLPAGFYVTAGGEVAGMFNASGVRELCGPMLREARRQGARWLTCFESLVARYAWNGWREVERYPFDPELAPRSWSVEEHGRPDCVRMVAP